MLEALFNPSSTAIIGASRSPNKVGHIITRNLISSGYEGDIYPVNPNAEKILGLKCYSSIVDIPFKVELAVIAIPARFVVDVAKECGLKGVNALIVVSAGFKETGREGAQREAELLSVGRKHNMIIQGPNSLGLINTSTGMNLSFATHMPKKGSISFISQSGALGTAVLDWIIEKDIGLHSFISLGNKVDLDETDFIEDMMERKDVGVILVYTESIDEGRRFIEITSRITRKKPVIVLKGGISNAGAVAAGSHTGALVGSFLSFILAENVEELFNFGLTLTQQPLPDLKGGVVIVTNAGGPGILATDQIEKHGLGMAQLSGETRNRLMEGLPSAASTTNPIDVLGDALSERYFFAMEEAARDEGVNSLLVLLTPQAMTEPIKTAKNIIKVREKTYLFRKPIITVFMGGGRVKEAKDLLKENQIPCFDFPKEGVSALSALYNYSKILKNEIHTVKVFSNVNKKRVRQIFNLVKNDGRVVLLGNEASEVMRAYGVSTPRMGLATSVEEAVGLAEDLGYPLVMKIMSPDILHKTDIGGVVLNIRTEGQVVSSFNNMIENVNRYLPQARIYGILIYKMVPQGREMIIGMSRDVQFGPLLMFGLGGIYVNFLKDVSFRLTPLSKADVHKMMEETRAYALLEGIRGEDPSDIESLKDIILRTGQLVTDFTEIAEMDLNPVMVYKKGEGSIALDVKITLSRNISEDT
jgi:acetyltransferase